MSTRVLAIGLTVVAAAASAPGVLAQEANPITASTKSTHEVVRGFILKSAEQFTEEQYSFKPTPDVRSFGQILGHIANANYMICGAAADSKGPGTDIEKTATTKADLQKALAESFEFCDKAFAVMTDAKGAEQVKFFGREQARLGVLAFNTAHNFEHYGNLVTYMRLKGMVPPSSAGRGPGE